MWFCLILKFDVANFNRNISIEKKLFNELSDVEIQSVEIRLSAFRPVLFEIYTCMYKISKIIFLKVCLFRILVVLDIVIWRIKKSLCIKCFSLTNEYTSVNQDIDTMH